MAQAVLPAAWHGAYQPPPCVVRECGVKGNGLEATRAIAEGEVVFTECPRVCVTLSAVPHCAHCCRSTAPPLPGLPPDSLQHWPSPATIKCPDCAESYCSEQCATAAASYHRVLCDGGAESLRTAAAAVPVAAAKDELMEYFEEETEAALVLPKKAQAFARLRAYCEEFTDGALDRCAEYPLMVLKLIAMAVSELRAGNNTELRVMLSFEDALVGATQLQWGNYATAPRDGAPKAMDRALIWSLVVEAIGMSTDEQVWAGGIGAVEFVLSVLFANCIRITPRSPFDIFMSRLRQEGDEQRRAAVRIAVQKLVKDAHEAQSDGGETCAPGEMDELIRGICGVSVGAMYAVHSKINHSCDFNIEVEGYHFDNSLIQVSEDAILIRFLASLLRRVSAMMTSTTFFPLNRIRCGIRGCAFL
eukprot:COSAG02_NODE_4868_length_4881_cov_7.175659_4_plen_417_part_00